MHCASILFFCFFFCCCLPAIAQLHAGVARVSITPLEEGIPSQLGGYGAREGRPAEGVLDTLYGKALVLEHGDVKGAIVTLDVCSVPINLVEETLTTAGVPGLTVDNTLMCASHSHTGLEGFALDRRNIANNPNIGIFSEPMLQFVVKRLATALQEANATMQPVLAASGAAPLPGMNRNRRGADCVDDEMTILRLDTTDGAPLAVLVNFAAHGTFVNENDMLLSGEWAGEMQRVVEELMGDDVTCLYVNGPEGDIAPVRGKGGSNYEQAYNYGRKVGIAAWRLATALTPTNATRFALRSSWPTLPQRVGAPDFLKIAGDEYNVPEEQLTLLLSVMFPETAPLYALRINDFQMATLPGEAICAIGASVKDALRQQGVTHPCVAALTSDYIGYILTKEEYHKSGYEVTASFYGDALGQLLVDAAIELGAAIDNQD